MIVMVRSYETLLALATLAGRAAAQGAPLKGHEALGGLLIEHDVLCGDDLPQAVKTEQQKLLCRRYQAAKEGGA